MGRLHKAIILWLFAAVLTPGGIALGQTMCSLTVRALAPDGRRPEVSISVTEKSGRTVEKDQEPESRDIEFCDLGSLPVNVTIGNDGSCNQVIVKDVPVAWNEPYLLRVTYDPEPCLQERPRLPQPVCRIVFRISLRGDKWVSGATISLSQPTTMELKADQFGRASITAKIGQEVSGVASFGSLRRPFNLKCATFELARDELIKLNPE